MNNTINDQRIFILVDIKKYRLRISKYTLHLLGDPTYIQLLINPKDMAVALRFSDHKFSGDQSLRITQEILRSDNSLELYSKYFIKKLREVCPELDPGHSYRMNGTIIYSEKTVLFSMKSLTCIDI